MRVSGLLVLAACAAPPPEHAFAWSAETFFGPGVRNLGGFLTSQLAAGDKDDGGVLLVQPAYAKGKPAAYVITEIWQAHPDLWVQPVYAFTTQTQTVFGVDTRSTFYSPFWRARVVQGTPGETYTNVAQLAPLPMQTGPLVTCPIVPKGVRPSSTEHPVLTDAGLRRPGDGVAFVNGAPVAYLDFGVDWQESEYDDHPLEAASFYVFTRAASDGGREALDVPAVLADDARHHAYVRRTEVVLPGPAGAFDPAAAPGVDAEQARWHQGRVAWDTACFANVAGFPAGCEWLDSEGAIRARLRSHEIVETSVTLTANPVLLP